MHWSTLSLFIMEYCLYNTGDCVVSARRERQRNKYELCFSTDSTCADYVQHNSMVQERVLHHVNGVFYIQLHIPVERERERQREYVKLLLTRTH